MRTVFLMARRLQTAAATLPPIVALTGFMAVGKSTVGHVLAKALHWRFLDLDCEIECRCHQPIREIFRTHGELYFRRMESGALRWVLQHTSGPTVIALGGGTFVLRRNANALQRQGAHVVFLELAVEELLDRCRCAADHTDANMRPLATDGERFCALYMQRLLFYRKAELTVHTHGKTVEKVAKEIVAALHLTATASRHR